MQTSLKPLFLGLYFQYCKYSHASKLFVYLYLIETPFNTIANRANPDEAALLDQGLLCLLMDI